jgi:hypothetical protein
MSVDVQLTVQLKSVDVQLTVQLMSIDVQLTVQLMSVAPHFQYSRTLPVVCATALVVCWNYLDTLAQESADLKLCDVYGASVVMPYLPVTKLYQLFV